MRLKGSGHIFLLSYSSAIYLCCKKSLFSIPEMAHVSAAEEKWLETPCTQQLHKTVHLVLPAKCSTATMTLQGKTLDSAKGKCHVLSVPTPFSHPVLNKEVADACYFTHNSLGFCLAIKNSSILQFLRVKEAIQNVLGKQDISKLKH